MTAAHDPPESYQFNKLREAGGSHRLTIVKRALENADVDPRPPRPEFAHIPASDSAWIGFDVDGYESQLARIRARRAVTEALSPDARIVGEFPVPIQGKLGSGVVLVPKGLFDALDLEVGDRMTTVALAPGAMLFVAEAVVEERGEDVEAAIDAARAVLEE